MDKPAGIKIIDHKTVWNKILSSSKLVIFCGSGISLFSPSNFPTGQEILNTLTDSIKTKFSKYGLPANYLDELRKLPLEYLVGLASEAVSTNELDNETKLIADYFCEVKPNRLHYLIASLLLSHKQCHVITTNYDTGIEEALLNISSPNSNGSIKVYSRSELKKGFDLNSNSIVKIHGCAKLDTPSDLVISTKQESAGLPPSILSALPDLFENSLVVFLGYSLSEPDCLEGLLSVKKFSAIWVDRNEESFNSNFRAKVILNNSTNPSLLFDLVPFIREPVETFQIEVLLKSGIELNHRSLIEPFDNSRQEKVNRGLCFYHQLIDKNGILSILPIVIQGLVTLRNFDGVAELLKLYSTIPGYSEYWYNCWLASIVRDKNKDWEQAELLFKKASKLPSISKYEFFNAKMEQLGIESLLFQRNFVRLRNVEKEIRELINESKKMLSQCLDTNKSLWQRMTGALQKILVQNISYQIFRSKYSLNESFLICNEAIQNLYQGGDINKRIEAERFLARISFRAYVTTKNNNFLIEALKETNKAMILFSLMGINMGVVNSKRQYAHYLILQNKSVEALTAIEELKNLLKDSPDGLSQTKVAALELLLALRRHKIKMLIKASSDFFKNAQYYSESPSKIKNLFLAISWFAAYITGLSG